jgi:excinuclease ABC subunit C
MSLQDKLTGLPKNPGVYFYKNKSGEIIYIGKAANLRNRVRQYFQKSRPFDPKTDALVAEIVDVEWTEVETELDAVFLEAEMVRRYMPRYNILLRDDKSFVYVRIDIKSKHPTVTFTRRPLDDKAEYFGPYQSKFVISSALKHLRRVFPYSTHAPTNIPNRACLQAQIGLCPGLEADLTTLKEYKKNLRQLMLYITGKRKKLISELEADMKRAAKGQQYEEAAKLRNRLLALKNLDSKIIFGDREQMDISKDKGLVELAELLKIEVPRRIEGYDISHLQGSDTVASMVVFAAGVPDKSQYRKFKSRVPGNDDFAHMFEVITRRFSERNIKLWGKPDLILIDGGKGQVSSALKALQEKNLKIPLIGLAKRYEEIIVPQPLYASPQTEKKSQFENADDRRKENKGDKTIYKLKKEIEKISQFEVVRLEQNSNALKLLQRIRDESHRFAVSYHSSLKGRRQTASQLDDVPGVGPATRKKLLKTFGSMRGVSQASEQELAETVGGRKAKTLINYLQTNK